MIAGEVLQQAQSVKRLYEFMLEPVCAANQLTETESGILIFLFNNPDRNTASDVVDLRMIPKANVSKAVESLMQKGLLSRTPDASDRRRIHLAPTRGAKALVSALIAAQNAFVRQLFSDFSRKKCRLTPR